MSAAGDGASPRPRADFLYIGMPKAGSTWLYEALRAHPGAFVPESKGLEFFDRNFDRGVEWYLGHFAACPAGNLAGELSHDTYACPDAARRISGLFPTMRLILCLREPGDAARSILQWWSTHTRAFGTSIEEMTAHRHYRALLAYRENLESFRREFDASQVLVLFYEDLRKDPRRFVRSVYGFLGLDADFVPPGLEAVSNAARAPRSATMSRVAYRLAGALRRMGAGSFVESAKASTLLGRALYGGPAPHRETDALRAAAEQARLLVAPDHAALAALTGRALPVEWTNPVAGS